MSTVNDLIHRLLSDLRDDAALWLGFGCGGFYRKVTASEALSALTKKQPDLPSLRVEVKMHGDVLYNCILATWIENCVCVVIVPDAWDYSTGSAVVL